jgi:hypothetical protein
MDVTKLVFSIMRALRELCHKTLLLILIPWPRLDVPMYKPGDAGSGRRDFYHICILNSTYIFSLNKT